MPILHVRALPQKDNSKIKPALRKTCAAIAEFYKCDPSQVWATWEEIPAGWYIEGTQDMDLQPESTHPPIAQLMCFEGSSPEQVEGLLEVASRTLSEALGLGNNIFMTYHEAKSGQVVAGNGVVRK